MEESIDENEQDSDMKLESATLVEDNDVGPILLQGLEEEDIDDDTSDDWLGIILSTNRFSDDPVIMFMCSAGARAMSVQSSVFSLLVKNFIYVYDVWCIRA